MRSRKQSRSRANRAPGDSGGGVVSGPRSHSSAHSVARGAPGPRSSTRRRGAAGREAELDLEPSPRAGASRAAPREPRPRRTGRPGGAVARARRAPRCPRGPARRSSRSSHPRRSPSPRRSGPSSRARARSASCEGERSSMCSSCSTRPRAAASAKRARASAGRGGERELHRDVLSRGERRARRRGVQQVRRAHDHGRDLGIRERRLERHRAGSAARDDGAPAARARLRLERATPRAAPAARPAPTTATPSRAAHGPP